MKEFSRPRQLVEAAIASIQQRDPAVLDACMAELNPTAEEVAQAYGTATMVAPYSGDSRTYMFLKARLDLVLVREHIAAQKRMADAQERLGNRLVALTRVLVALAIATAAVALVSAWLAYRALTPEDNSAADRAAWTTWAEDFWYRDKKSVP